MRMFYPRVSLQINLYVSCILYVNLYIAYILQVLHVCTCCIHINDDVYSFRSASKSRQVYRSPSQNIKASIKLQSIQWIIWWDVSRILPVYQLVSNRHHSPWLGKQSTLMTTENIQKFANRYFNFSSLATSKCYTVRPSGTNLVNNALTISNCRGTLCQLKE